MIEHFPKPSEILFALSLTVMTTPALNEIARSLIASDIADRNCPPLLTPDTYNQKTHLILVPLIETSYRTRNYPSFPTIKASSPETQEKLDELNQQLLDANKMRYEILKKTPAPIKSSIADGIGLLAGMYAIGIALKLNHTKNSS